MEHEPSGDRTALVLSAGMMFGAYQAGVWKAVSDCFRPDMVIGTSSGALNAWAIAGGCSAEELAELWLNPAIAATTRLRFPFPPWKGIFDARPLAALAERLYLEFRPTIEIGVTVTEVPALRPHLFRSDQISWRHLAASCSMPFGFQPVTIDGKAYADGGLLGPLPIWATGEMGATRALAIHALPKTPNLLVRGVVKGFRLVAPRLPSVPTEVEVFTISPSQSPGSLRDFIVWRRENIERLIALGYVDGQRLRSRLVRRAG